MHDGMPCGPIQGKGQGHTALKVRNSSIFEIYLVCHFQLEPAYDSVTRGQYLNLMGPDF